MLSMILLLNIKNEESSVKTTTTTTSKEQEQRFSIKQDLAGSFLQEFYIHTKDLQTTEYLFNILTKTRTDTYEVTLAELFLAFGRDILLMDEAKKNAKTDQMKSRVVQIIIQIIKHSRDPQSSPAFADNVKFLIKELEIISAFKFLSENSKNANIKSVAERFVPTLVKYVQ